LPDKICIKRIFYHKFWYNLNLKNPKTFNEKLQRLKLYDRKPEYTQMVDKYEAKKYVASIIWEQYIIPTLWIYNKFDEIDFDKLPNQFVLKCTHDSGTVIICKDKKNFDLQSAKYKINERLKINYYYLWRERPYKKVKPRIIAEKYMVDESGSELKDYKVFCFGWEPKLIQVDYDRFINHKRNIYDLNRDIQPFEIEYPSDKYHHIKKPICLHKILEFAKNLSKNIPHLRVDFYIINRNIYFWEMTFYHWAGIEKFFPEKWNYTLGSRIKLPTKKK